MLWYTLVVLLYVITYCMALHNETEISAHGLDDMRFVSNLTQIFQQCIASVQKFLPNTNENLIPVQQIIYIYGPRQWKIQESSNLIKKAGSDYLITPGIGAHKFHIGKMSWNQARKVCIAEGGQLAVINSMSEEKILLGIMEENKKNEAWLGIHDLYQHGDWNTIIGESLGATGYSKWYPGEPNYYAQNQHCVTLEKGDSHGLCDRNCDEEFGFFCEIAP